MSNEQRIRGISRSAETDEASVPILPHILACIELGEAPRLPEGAIMQHPKSVKVGEKIFPWTPGIREGVQHMYGAPARYEAVTIHKVFSLMNQIREPDQAEKLFELVDTVREMVGIENAIYYEDAINLYYYSGH